MKVSGWGRYPVIDTKMTFAHSISALEDLWAQNGAHAGMEHNAIARGNGRSYGDSALNAHQIISTLGFNLMESFDEASGLLVAGAGVLLSEIIDTFLPRGWFLTVSPGTKLVSLGGAVGSDVHGKDHHVHGSFAQSLAFIDVVTPDQGLLRCSPTEHSELFHATTGGMGLTGIVVRVGLYLKRVPSAYVRQKLVVCPDLKSIMECFEDHADLPYSVAWIDCLKQGAHSGRSLFMGGDFATTTELQERAPKKAAAPFSCKARPLSVPLDFPSFALNSLSVKAFNALYFNHGRMVKADSIVDYNKFFYPLDAIAHWNRIYGHRGFTQYQFVIPRSEAPQALPQILEAIADRGQGSFLTVLKLFGAQPKFKGNLSFPEEGYTLALDFAVNAKLFPLLERLDAMVIEHGGHIYLAKDCRLSKESFAAMYGSRINEFLEIKAQVDRHNQLSSLQSERLGLTV